MKKSRLAEIPQLNSSNLLE